MISNRHIWVDVFVTVYGICMDRFIFALNCARSLSLSAFVFNFLFVSASIIVKSIIKCLLPYTFSLELKTIITFGHSVLSAVPLATSTFPRLIVFEQHLNIHYLSETHEATRIWKRGKGGYIIMIYWIVGKGILKLLNQL